jgi:hypothetical protein
LNAIPALSGAAVAKWHDDLILQQAKELGTIEWIYFEGGEPFL